MQAQSNTSQASDKVAPHPVLPGYYDREEERRAFLDRIFDETAVDYDRIERLIGLGSGGWYREQALRRAGLAAGMRVVDVGIGTGLVARAAAAIVGDPTCVTGVDPSKGMLACARLPDGVVLTEGRAEAIPLPDDSADFLSMGFALRHVASLGAAFAEFRRVVVPGGRVLIMELTRPRGRVQRALLKAYLRGVVPTVAQLTGHSPETSRMWRYYWDTIEACAPPETILSALHEAGFEVAERKHVELGLFSEYVAY